MRHVYIFFLFTENEKLKIKKKKTNFFNNFLRQTFTTFRLYQIALRKANLLVFSLLYKICPILSILVFSVKY